MQHRPPENKKSFPRPRRSAHWTRARLSTLRRLWVGHLDVFFFFLLFRPPPPDCGWETLKLKRTETVPTSGGVC